MITEEEYENTLNDNLELIDWAANNMNWGEVKEFAKKIKEADPILEDAFEECWRNGEREIIEAE